MDEYVNQVSPIFWDPMTDGEMELCKKLMFRARFQDEDIKMIFGYLIANEIARRFLQRLFRHFRVTYIAWVKRAISASYIFLRVIAHDIPVGYPYHKVILSTVFPKHLNPGDIDNEHKRTNEYLTSMFFSATKFGSFVYNKIIK